MSKKIWQGWTDPAKIKEEKSKPPSKEVKEAMKRTAAMPGTSANVMEALREEWRYSTAVYYGRKGTGTARALGGKFFTSSAFSEMLAAAPPHPAELKDDPLQYKIPLPTVAELEASLRKNATGDKKIYEFNPELGF